MSKVPTCFPSDRISTLSLVVPLLTAFMLVGGCATSSGSGSSTIRFPYKWMDTPGFGGMIAERDIVEPSGIVYHPTRGTLFVVSDEGELVELTTDGRVVTRTAIPGDLEGVTVVPETGLLYVLIEGVDEIVEFDPAQGMPLRRFPINREYEGNPNFIQKQAAGYDNGCESITFVPDSVNPEGGTFYIGNQWDPPCVFELSVPLRTGKDGDPTHIVRVLPTAVDDPAALYFDPRTRLLNIVSDADNLLLEVTLDGKVVRQYAFLGDNQEGLALDGEGYLYIAQDSGGILRVKDLR